MFTFNYDFKPGDTAFTVTEKTCIDEVTVLQLTFVTFLNGSGNIEEQVHYIAKDNVDDTTVRVTPEYIFETFESACEHVKVELLGPSPTPTPSSSMVTPTPTPSVSESSVPTPTPSLSA